MGTRVGGQKVRKGLEQRRWGEGEGRGGGRREHGREEQRGEGERGEKVRRNVGGQARGDAARYFSRSL